MSKALMEKAFEKWFSNGLDDGLPHKSSYPTNMLMKERLSECWQASATWQREQLKAEKNKLIKDIEVCRKATDGTDDYSVGMRNGMEVILCTLEKREPRMDNCLPRTNNLSEREQLISELREFIDDNDIIVDRDGHSVLIAKLDLLEGEK